MPWEAANIAVLSCQGPGRLQEAAGSAREGGDGHLAGVEAFSTEMPATKNTYPVLLSFISLQPVAPIFPNELEDRGPMNLLTSKTRESLKEVLSAYALRAQSRIEKFGATGK